MDTKKEIIMAMKEVFSEKGYMASMADVAKIVGIKVPSIYSHYKSKDEIIYFCIEDEIENFKRHYQASLIRDSEASIESVLQHVFFQYILYFKDINKLRFWNNFDLIPNLELRQKGINMYSVFIADFLNVVKQLFHQAITSGEFDEKKTSDMDLLYVVAIQGILRGMPKFEGIGLDTDLNYEKLWNVLVRIIKK